MPALLGLHNLCNLGFLTRMKTSVRQHLLKDLVQRMTSFIYMYACEWHNIPLNLIGNMDEAAVWTDIPANNTREVRCSKSISLLTTGYEKNYSPAMAAGSMA